MIITVIGCGWLGLPLAQKLVNEGHTVYGSVRNERNFSSLTAAGILPFRFDSDNDDELRHDIREQTEILILTLPPVHKEEIMRYGNILSQLALACKNCRHVLFTSSTGVYPDQTGVYKEDFLFLEREKQNALVQAELALQASVGKRLTVLRLGGLFGAGRHPALHLQGKSHVSNPFGVVNLVHRDDVIRCIIHLLPRPEGFVNVVFPEHPWRKEYYTKIFRQFGLKPIGFEASTIFEKYVSTSKLTETLSFRFSHSIYALNDSILDTE